MKSGALSDGGALGSDGGAMGDSDASGGSGAGHFGGLVAWVVD